MHERAVCIRQIAVALCLAAGFTSGCARAQPEAPYPPALEPLQQLRQDIADATRTPGVQNATWGIAVQSLTSQELILELNASALLVPASVAKLITLATAAEAVGWDYTFKTTLAATGSVANGVLLGDLVIAGNGDPTIEGTGGADLSDWIEAVQASGISRISGRIIGDDDSTEEPLPPFAWAWDDLGYPYGALPGALNLGENVMEVTLVPGSVAGTTAALSITADVQGFPVTNGIITGLPDSAAEIRPVLQPSGLGVQILGTLPAGSAPVTFSVSVGNPTLWFATVLRQRLADADITVDGPPLDIDNLSERPNTSSVLHVHRSAPLSTIAKPMIKNSLNLYAETILWLNTGPTGARTTDAALDALRKRLDTWGIPDSYYQLVDGSGLSRRNTLTASALVTVLDRFFDPRGSSPWMQALPVAGREGTLESRLAGTPAENNLTAKTGSMSNIKSLAGYVHTRDGEPLAFAIIVNNFEGSATTAVEAIDRIAVTLASFTRSR